MRGTFGIIEAVRTGQRIALAAKRFLIAQSLFLAGTTSLRGVMLTFAGVSLTLATAIPLIIAHAVISNNGSINTHTGQSVMIFGAAAFFCVVFVMAPFVQRVAARICRRLKEMHNEYAAETPPEAPRG